MKPGCPPRVLFYVQHLLGIGHVRRAASIARALCEHGLSVTIASKILQRNVSREDNERLIDDTLRQLESSPRI